MTICQTCGESVKRRISFLPEEAWDDKSMTMYVCADCHMRLVD